MAGYLKKRTLNLFWECTGQAIRKAIVPGIINFKKSLQKGLSFNIPNTNGSRMHSPFPRRVVG